MPNKHRLSKQEINKLDYLLQLREVRTNTKRHRRLMVYLEYWQARYDAGIREVDYHIGNLKTQLEQMGLWKDTYVIVTSDHGEALAEHGHWEHGLSLHHPELNVPLFLRWPGTLPRAKQIAGTVQLIDLMPTLIDQLGLPAMKGLQGRSLTADIESGHSQGLLSAFAEGIKLGPEQKALYVDNWKLMITPSASQRRLYDVADDLLEQKELSAWYATKAKQLAAILQEQTKINAKLGSGVSVEAVTLTPEQLERLRSLGYLK